MCVVFIRSPRLSVVWMLGRIVLGRLEGKVQPQGWRGGGGAGRLSEAIRQLAGRHVRAQKSRSDALQMRP